MEKVIVEKQDGKVRIGVMRGGTFHYFDAPSGVETPEQINSFFASMAAKCGKSHVEYEITYSPSFHCQ